ncbi:MAG: MdtA/MuxA family multidrug efflux RND transporter periplasmic adaptor subunit [Alphaproteobacteria bacterium]|nr:MdtA/MuxA family multidrug efflux RND transporter periplasmic adaptor subunit [Alphaproteobacteria bacterium]
MMSSLENLYAHFLRFYTRQRQTVQIIGGVLIVSLVYILFFHSSDQAKRHSRKGDKQSPTVLIAAIKKNDIPVYLTALGTVTPAETVTIKTQINGQLMRVLFQEGQLVKAGDLLAEIDSRPYTAQLLQYEGQLAKDIALLENAKLDLERYKTLVKQDAISKQVLDTQVSLVQQYEGTVKSDQGLIDAAKLNQTYCKIVSPITGRAGMLSVDPGNYVQTTDPNGLVVINNINPIFVVFSIPEDNLQTILKQMNGGAKLKVEAHNRDQNKLLATGTLATVDNQIDTTTGTIKFKALFENNDNSLFTNQFVNVRLLVNTLRDSMIVPTAAVQHGAKGAFIYKLKEDHTVTIIPVVIKTVNGNETAIEGKISPGENIVVEGTDKLNEGTMVTVSEKKPKDGLLEKNHSKHVKSS